MNHKQQQFISVLIRQLRLPLVSNSFYLLGGRFGSTALIFVFWALAARTIAPEAIGLVVAANSALVILTILSDLGLSSGIVRFATSDRDRGTELLNSSIAVGWVSSTVLGIIFIIGIPLWSPGLQPLRRDGLLAVSFVFFTIVISLLNMHMAAMLSKRRADYIFWRFIIATFLSIPLLLIFVRGLPGFRAAFWAFNLPALLILLGSSLFILPRFFQGYHPFGRLNLGVTLQLIRYAGANYIATLLWEIPTFVLPIMAASVISAEAAAFFYMPWVIGLSILSIPQMVGTSLFAEGSYDSTALLSLMIKAGLLIALIVAPIFVILWFWGDVLLGIIGKNYVDIELLRLILLSVLPYSINLIFAIYLRVNILLKEVIAFSALMSLTVICSAYALSSSIGSRGLAMGWLLGQIITSAALLAYFAIHRIRSSRNR